MAGIGTLALNAVKDLIDFDHEAFLRMPRTKVKTAKARLGAHHGLFYTNGMKVFWQRFRRDISAIAWLTLALILFLSLISFRPTDPSFNSIGTGLKVQNYCGYFGSFIADLAYQFLGLAAWILVVATFRLGLLTFRGRETEITFARVMIATLLTMTLASLLALYLPQTKIFSQQIAVGGMLGSLLSQSLVSVFNHVGVSILLWSLALILLVFYSERSLRELMATPRIWLGQASGPLLNRVRQRGETEATKPTRPVEAESEAAKLSGRAAQLLANVSSGVAELAAKATKKSRTTDEEAAERFEPEDVAPESSLNTASSEAAAVPRRKVKLKTKVERRIENWRLPDLALLEDPPATRARVDEREILRKSEILVDKLVQFSVRGEVRGAKPGPAVTMYEFKPAADVKISKITELADDLSLALSSESVRIIAPIPGRDVVGIETSNSSRETVYLKDILAHDSFWSDKFKLPLALGRQANGEAKVVDLRKMPHLLVAGTTGSGKSVFVVGAITGLLFRHSPKTLRLILVDPKQVDLAAFSNVPHLLMPPIREPKKAVTALKWAIREMDKRYRSMSKFGARGIEQFNEIVEALPKDKIEEHEKFNELCEQENRKPEQYYFTSQPYIVIVVEEFGDLMAVDKQNVEHSVVRLAQMARACGIHLILAMQSPRKDVVTGLIKTNIPGRISFKVASKMDSRIILDDSGAERLLAQGDMLFLAPGVAKPERHHGPWLSEDEITSIMSFWAEQGEPQFDPLAMKALEGSGGGFDFGAGAEAGGEGAEGFGEGGEEDEYDEKYDEVLAWVSAQKEVSASLLQRKFRLGYPRAARMIEIFEREGVVGPANGSKPRQVLISSYTKEA